MKELIESGRLGRIYSVANVLRNGTARLVRDSAWRDKGAGACPDLGSHLLDTALFWFGRPSAPFRVFSANRFENRAFDHVAFGANGSHVLRRWKVTTAVVAQPLYMRTCSFRSRQPRTINRFANGGRARSRCAHASSRAARPDEEPITLEQPDPTWEIEYRYFQAALHRWREQHRQRYLDQRRAHRSLAARSGRHAMTKPVLGFAGNDSPWARFWNLRRGKGFQGNLLRSRFHSCSTAHPRRDPGVGARASGPSREEARSDLLFTQDSAMLSVCDVVYVRAGRADRRPGPQATCVRSMRRSRSRSTRLAATRSSSSCRKCPRGSPGRGSVPAGLCTIRWRR